MTDHETMVKETKLNESHNNQDIFQYYYHLNLFKLLHITRIVFIKKLLEGKIPLTFLKEKESLGKILQLDAKNNFCFYNFLQFISLF